MDLFHPSCCDSLNEKGSTSQNKQQMSIIHYQRRLKKIAMLRKHVASCKLCHPEQWFYFFYFYFFMFIFLISWRLITLQYCSGFCHTLTRISHGFTCIPHPDSPSHLSLHLIPLDLPSAPGPSTCLMHPTWAGDLFHPR